MGRILVVDDDEAIRDYYREIFRRNFPDYGFLESDSNACAIALANGVALRLATGFDISLMITDHERQNWREIGSDLVRELRGAGAAYPILMISAHHPSELRQMGMSKIGVNAILNKIDIVNDGAMFLRIVREFLEQGNSPTYEAYANAQEAN